MRGSVRPLPAAAAMLAAALPAAAQSVCDERQTIVEKLDRSYGERPSFAGLAGDGGLMEVLTSKAGTWSLLVTGPDGKSCLVAAGEAWQRTHGKLAPTSLDPGV